MKHKVKTFTPGMDASVTSQFYHVHYLKNFWMQYVEILFRPYSSNIS